MLKFFKHSYIAQLVAIVLLVAALWIPVFVSDTPDPVVGSPTTPLYNVLATLFGFSSLAITILTFVVFVVSVFFFNSMMTVNQLVTRNSSIAALVFVLCLCCTPLQNEYYPFLLACPFIMMAMQIIYLVYQIEKPETYLMNAGLFISLASMLYFPSIVLIIWVLLSLLVMEIKKFRYFLIPILGFLLPYFILLAYFYFTRSLVENVDAYLLAFNGLGFEKLAMKTSETIVLAVFFVLLVMSFLIIKSRDADNSLSTRKKICVTMLLLVFGFLTLFMQKPMMSNGLILMILAVFVSMALCYVKKTKVVDIVIFVIMMAVVAGKYLPFFGVEL